MTKSATNRKSTILFKTKSVRFEFSLYILPLINVSSKGATNMT